ncbi:hypothetical protein CWI36_1859p0010, partial [Hamiltosporidium magnivora]
MYYFKTKKLYKHLFSVNTATLLEGVSVYKYLGIIEDSRGIPTRSSFEEVQSKLIARRTYASATLGLSGKSKEISTKRAAILEVDNNNKTHLALIKGFLKVKYRLVEEVTKKSLEEAQLAKLCNEIEKRKLPSKLYYARKNELVSVSDSSRWLKRGNIRPRNEAVF